MVTRTRVDAFGSTSSHRKAKPFTVFKASHKTGSRVSYPKKVTTPSCRRTGSCANHPIPCSNILHMVKSTMSEKQSIYSLGDPRKANHITTKALAMVHQDVEQNFLGPVIAASTMCAENRGSKIVTKEDVRNAFETAKITAPIAHRLPDL